MALPGSDPYRAPDPTIYNYAYGGAEWGVDYDFIVDMGTSGYATKVSNFYLERVSDGKIWKPVHMHILNAGEDGFSMRSRYIRLRWVTFSFNRFHVENPIWYLLQTPAHIMLAIAHWHCGIAEANIDVTSFDDLHTHQDGNTLYRTVAFHERSAIDIIKELNEQSGDYLYVNGAHQLAADYFSHEPSDTPDWTFDDDNIIRLIRFGIIRDRKMPGKVRTFYDGRQVCPGSPKFGIYERDNPLADWTEKEQIMSKIYNAHYIDDADETGGYIDFTDYISVKVEVKAIGHLVDIGESFKLDVPSLAMSIDADYLDNFVIHEIDLSLDGMSAIVTGVKKTTWNYP